MFLLYIQWSVALMSMRLLLLTPNIYYTSNRQYKCIILYCIVEYCIVFVYYINSSAYVSFFNFKKSLSRDSFAIHVVQSNCFWLKLYATQVYN